MSKILVTGGAGFIGSHVAKKMIDRGDEIIIVDDFNDRYDPRLKEERVKNLFIGTTLPTIIRGDICDLSLLKNIFAENKIQKVLHLAAWAAVQTSIERPHIYTAVNIDGTVNILEEARKNGVESIVFASSSSVYGGRVDVPFKETDDVSRPISPYAATKAAGEIMCATWHNLYGLPISCLRFFTVYGPWGRPEMALFRFAEAIMRGETVEMRGPETQRDFTYIDDCAAGIMAAVDKPQGFQIFNLGESDAVPLPRFIKAIENALGKEAKIKEVPLPAGDVPRTLADITKAENLLGYKPKLKVEEGVRRFADWYLKWYVPHFLPDLA